LLASSRSRNKPERIMAFLLVMTGCVWVDAALEYRIRTALNTHDATFPNPQGPSMQHPTARGVLHDWVGMHVLRLPGPWPLGRNRTEEHQQLLQRLGTADETCYR
jgi:hypothetical protein